MDNKFNVLFGVLFLTLVASGCGKMRPTDVAHRLAPLSVTTTTKIPIADSPFLSAPILVAEKKPQQQKKGPSAKSPKESPEEKTPHYKVDPRSWSVCKNIVNNPKYKVPWGDNYVIYAEVDKKTHKLKRDKKGNLVGYGLRSLPRKCQYHSKYKAEMSRTQCLQQSKYNYWHNGFCQKCLKVNTKYRWLPSWSKIFFHELQKLENNLSSENENTPRSLVSISQQLIQRNTDKHYQTPKGQTVEFFKFKDDIKGFCPQISNDQSVYKHALFWQSLFKYISYQESSHHPHAILCRRAPDQKGRLTDIWYPNVGLLQVSPHLLKRARRVSADLVIYPENADINKRSIYYKYGCSGEGVDSIEGLLKIKNNFKCGMGFAAALINNDKQIYGKLQPSVKTYRENFRSYVPFYGGLPRYWQPMRNSDKIFIREPYKNEEGKIKYRRKKITKRLWIQMQTRKACSIYFNPKKTTPYAASIIAAAKGILGVGHYISPSQWAWNKNIIYRTPPLPKGKTANLRHQEQEDILYHEQKAKEWPVVPRKKLRKLASLPEEGLTSVSPKYQNHKQQKLSPAIKSRSLDLASKELKKEIVTVEFLDPIPTDNLILENNASSAFSLPQISRSTIGNTESEAVPTGRFE